ncbi:MAG: GbsR/MarR family transcriptional regulator [Novosphingobium sp.]
MSNASRSASTQRFMDEMVGLMEPWGWSRTVARTFAYLMVRETPATLDEIAADLGIAKSNASMATRELVDYGNAVRIRQPGTKQLLFDAPSAQTGPFAMRSAMLCRMADLLGEQREGMGEAAVRRLSRQADFLRAMGEAIDGVIREKGDAAPE